MLRVLAAACVLAFVWFAPPPIQPTVISAREGEITGVVLGPDEKGISGATVRLYSFTSDYATTADASGEFRFAAIIPGTYELSAKAPGTGVGRVKVTTVRGCNLNLPFVRVPAATFFRVHVLTPDGLPVSTPRIVWDSYDRAGRPIESDASAQTDAEGVTTIGPLPRGIFVAVIDTSPWARSRLPEQLVTGELPYVDAGTVHLERGGVVEVWVRDAAGYPVPNHEVRLDDLYPFSPVVLAPIFTDADGRARFDRLSAGRYYASTRALRPCTRVIPTVQRAIIVERDGLSVSELPVSAATLTTRLMSSTGPLSGLEVALAPDLVTPVMPPWVKDETARSLWRERSFGALVVPPCADMTDRNGEATLRNVPSGPARLRIAFPSSLWSRRVSVPPRDSVLSVDVPNGVVWLRVIDDRSGRPVTGARVVWTSAGARVEATVPAAGDVALDGIADASAAIDVRAAGYAPYRASLASPPSGLHTIRVTRLPDRSLRCRVESEGGQPLAGAVIELAPADPIETTWIAATDARGEMQFPGLSSGAGRLRVTAAGHAPFVTSVTIPLERPEAMLPIVMRKLGLTPER